MINFYFFEGLAFETIYSDLIAFNKESLILVFILRSLKHYTKLLNEEGRS